MSMTCNHNNFSSYNEEEKSKECQNPQCPVKKVRNPDGSIKPRNPHLERMDSDYLYHIGFGKGTDDLEKIFGDVKFVVMGGQTNRMKAFAEYIKGELGYDTDLEDLSAAKNRYCMYKVGPVISVSHGLGVSSLIVLLHEMIKLVTYAKCQNPIFIRMGSSGGVGIEGGTVAISTGAVDGMLKSNYELPILGKMTSRPAILDKKLAEEIKSLCEPSDNFEVVTGKTMCALDFYEGQGRLDGSLCEYEEKDKMKFLHDLKDHGVVNIEMEVIPLAAITYEVGIKAACVDVAYLNRLNGDQVTTPLDLLEDFQNRPQKLIGRYIKKYVQNKQ